MDLNSSVSYVQPRNDLIPTSHNFEDIPFEKPLARSRYKVPFRNTGTCNASELVPFFWKYVMPNMTDSIDTSAVIRMQPTVHSPMSNIFADFYYFYVAGKDLWTDDENGSFKEFFGEQKGQYVSRPLSTYQIPQVTIPTGGFSPKSVADYLGVPPGVDPGSSYSVSALPFRAYGLVWNSFYRDENVSPEALVYTGSSTQTGAQKAFDPLNTAALGGDLLPVCRPHDLFGAALPFPFKGDPSDSAISLNADGRLPVNTGADHFSTSDLGLPVIWYKSTQVGDKLGSHNLTNYNLGNTASSNTYGPWQGLVDLTNSGGETDYMSSVYPTNLWANVRGNVDLNISITDLRQSIALQHYFESLARGGSRYYEVVSSLYGTTIDPLALDRPIYLGGKRVPISITNVVQNTPTSTGTTGLGQVAGYSCTSDFDNSFTMSFDEHGIVLGVMCIRSEKQYQNSLDRNWKLKDRLEFYTPGVFDGLSEVEVLNSDIYLKGSDSSGDNDKVFGYQEMYYWERYRPHVISGEFRSSYATPLDSWHLADNYSALPTLAGYLRPNSGGTALEKGWIYDNTRENLDRILQVTSAVSDQFYFDIWVDDTVVSPLPIYSIPGISKI